MKKGLITGVGLLLIFMVVGCNENITSKEPQNIKKLVENYSAENVNNVSSASITSTEFIVTDNNETTYDLPEDEFFVSIAPFTTTTHPCTTHSLTSCQGELAEKEFDVYVQDAQGNVFIDETMTSLKNGFIDLWLPRNKTYHVKIQYDGKIAESEISTFEDSRTCVTTMQLI